MSCGSPFIFESGEQSFYESKEFTPPKRCRGCRDKKRAQRQQNEQEQGGGMDL
jgi:hypothetical protein